MSGEDRAPTKPIIEAHDVIVELLRKERVGEQSGERPEADQPVYVLSDRSISGKLDLKHRTVEVAVYIQGCEFLDEVDLRYCEFKQAVNFSDCTFRKHFNSGDETEAHTIYRKDLNCNGAVFEGPFGFNGGRVEGSAYFSRTQFLDEDREVDFAWASVERTLEFQDTFFKGRAIFTALKCGGGFFRDATFEGEADFSYASFGGNLSCEGATFKGDARFARASFGGNLECTGATFGAKASFNALKCGGIGFFNPCTFKGDARFFHASFGGDLVCQGATFGAKAIFTALKCRGGFFGDATFKGEADFSYASFVRNLGCQGATFGAEAIFTALECSGSGFFRDATFKGEADFSYASFVRNLECTGATFGAKAIFQALKCGGSGFFDPSTFKGEADFRFASFGVNLICIGARFAGPVDLTAARVSRLLQLAAATFEQQVTLYQTKIGVLLIGDTLPFGERSYADLRECSFEGFDGDAKVARGLAKKQRPGLFSRDPYLQLEKYYRGVGNEVEAKRIHFLGRSELRKNAISRDGHTKWPPATMLGDACLWLLTGYGVRTWLLLIPISIFLIVGTRVFWPAGALEPKASGTTGTSNGVQAGEVYLASAQPNGEQSQGGLGEHLSDRVLYSLDLFLPVVNLHVDENWSPEGLGREIYAAFHSMVGWILVPLLLASLAGIIRRE